MNDRELIYGLRWLCDLADAMQSPTVSVVAVRDLVDRAEQTVPVPAVDLNVWKEIHGR